MKARALRRIWGHPWDYEYLLQLEQRKLKEMAAYFKKSQLTVGWERQTAECELCVKLIDIILEKDTDVRIWLKSNFENRTDETPYRPFAKYVNLRNVNRFSPELDTDIRPGIIRDSAIVEIRKVKALHLYNLIRNYRMFTWWD